MEKPLFSSLWYRVSHLKPALAPQTLIARHSYRGQPWYVLQDPLSERHHRVAPATYFLIGLFDGQRTLDEIWRASFARLADAAPTQDEVIQLLMTLDQAELLSAGVSQEMAALQRKTERVRQGRWRKLFVAPLAHRAPLLQADPAFEAMAGLARAVFSRPALLVWAMIVLAGAVAAAMHGRELTETVLDRALTPWSLAAYGLAYLLLKCVHEFCHGLALKAFGGKVSEIGVMLLLLAPMPYVDASRSTAFASKWRRIAVGAAGVMSELLLAALAALLWPLVEPGAFRSFLFAVITVGSLSTLVFNGNPLLKFDGYYVLSDLIETPNLAQRSSAYLGYLFRRYGLGLASARSPVTARGERKWFLIYAPAAAVYRIALAFSIALFLAREFPLAGMILSAWVIAIMILWPMLQSARRLWREAGSSPRRGRAAFAVGVFCSLIFVVAFLVPLPRATMAEGVWMAPEGGQVRAEAEGFLVRFVAEPGSRVTRGTALAHLEDNAVEAELRAIDAEIGALAARLTATAFTDQTQAALLRVEIAALEASRERHRFRQRAQVLRAQTDGDFIVDRASDRIGAFFQRGAPLGYVASPDNLYIAGIVGQDAIGPLQQGIVSVTVRDADAGVPEPARLARIIPGGQTRLPSKALSVEGGGRIPLDPRAPSELRTLEPVFQFELQTLQPPRRAFVGRRIHVRFEHEPEPAGRQAFRVLQRILLSRFSA